MRVDKVLSSAFSAYLKKDDTSTSSLGKIKKKGPYNRTLRNTKTNNNEHERLYYVYRYMLDRYIIIGITKVEP